MSSLKERAANCVTHHHACDCREYKQQARIKELEVERDVLRKELTECDGYNCCPLAAENKALREALKIAISNMPPSMRLDIEQRISRATGEGNE